METKTMTTSNDVRLAYSRFSQLIITKNRSQRTHKGFRMYVKSQMSYKKTRANCIKADRKQHKSRNNTYSSNEKLMCNCPNVHFYEVDFKLAGMQVVPSHKNCGDALNEDQNSKFEKELLKYWGFENKAR